MPENHSAPAGTRRRKLGMVIPTYNERRNVETLVPALFALDIEEELHVFFVDDSSPDGTGVRLDEMAAGNPRLHVLHRAVKSGLGSAYLDGFSEALKCGMDILGQMDADFSHSPSLIVRLLPGLEKYDVVLGSKYCPGGGYRQWPGFRVLISRTANKAIRLRSGLPYLDCTSGFKLFRKKVWENLISGRFVNRSYAFQAESILKAHNSGYSIAEYPILFSGRENGRSKMHFRDIAESVLYLISMGRAKRRKKKE